MKSDKRVWDWRTYILKYAPDNSIYKHLLLTLSCYMNSAGGSCFPSIDTLEEVTSLSRPTIIKYLKQSERDGWLKISQHGYGDSRWKRNEYTASLPPNFWDLHYGTVVKEINHNTNGGKTDNETVVKEVNHNNNGGKTDNETVVKEVNSISSYTNSPYIKNVPTKSADVSKKSIKINVQGETFDEKSKIIDVLKEINMSDKPNSEEEKQALLMLHIWKDVNLIQPDNNITLKAKLGNWFHPIRLLVERDGHSYERIWKIWKRVNDDSFWKKNILSTEKFRDKFSDLRIKFGSLEDGNSRINRMIDEMSID